MPMSQEPRTTLPSPAIDRMYGETLTLLGRAQDLARGRKAEAHAHPVEALRVTARLAGGLAWLLAAKAVAAGEIGRSEMARDHALAPRERAICLSGGEVLDPNLKTLSEASLKLYLRVTRLDDLLARRARNSAALLNPDRTS